MISKEELRDFFEFLKKNNAFELYLENLNEKQIKGLRQCWAPRGLISSYYYNGWNKEPSYWGKIHTAWLDICRYK